MRIYFDNNVPYPLMKHFGPEAECIHAVDLGWERLANGELVQKVAAEFEVMITCDKNMAHQTPIWTLKLNVCVLDCLFNRVEVLLPFVPLALEAAKSPKLGEYTFISVPR